MGVLSPIELGWIELIKATHNTDFVEKLKKEFPSPLHAATILDDLDLFKKILELNLPINLADESIASTALFLAMKFGIEEMVLMLIEKGADLHKTGINGWTYLHEAILRNKPIVVETLIKQLNVNAIAYKLDEKGFSCAFLTKDPINSSQTIPISPLYLALRLNHDKINRQKIALILLQNGADISFQHPKGVNLLHLAIENGYEEVCEILLNKKMDPNQGYLSNVDVKSLDCSEDVRSLMKPIWEISPVLMAIYKNSTTLVKLLLNHGAHFFNFSNFYTNPILIIFGHSLNKEMLKAFIDKGFPIDHEGGFGE